MLHYSDRKSGHVINLLIHETKDIVGDWFTTPFHKFTTRPNNFLETPPKRGDYLIGVTISNAKVINIKLIILRVFILR
jgi:hypothetical protein